MIIVMFITIFPVIATSEHATITAEAAGTKLIAITFDDGPSAQTGRLLDGLKARGAKATFFMNGVNGSNGTKNHMDLLYRMVNEGHQLANHTFSHRTPFSSLSSAQMASEEQGVESYLFTAMGGSYTDCVRIPGGGKSSVISSTINAPMILWSVDTHDWRDRNANTVYSRIVSGASDGAIILCHDLYPTSVDGALSAISTLQSQGYEFVTVAELFRRRGITLNNGSTYSSAPNNGITLPAYQTPTISTTDGTFGKVNITLSSPEKEPLYYITDGSEPKLSSKRYMGTFAVDVGTTVKVRGIDKYGTRTSVASKTATANYDAVFNATYYANKYPDLKKAFGYDKNKLLRHFIYSGIYEGRQASPAFNITYYMNTYPDLQKVFKNNKVKYINHFNFNGMKEARRSDKNFDVLSYKNQYQDLRIAYGSDLSKYYSHYSNVGYFENRNALGINSIVSPVTKYNGVDYSAVYDYSYYIKNNPDVARVYGSDDVATLRHFVNCGMREGRQAKSTFNVNYYKSNYKDLINAFGNDTQKYYLHYINCGIKEKRIANRMIKNTIYMGKDYSDVYDFEYYYSHYPDLQKAYGRNEYKLLQHYVTRGILEGRKAK